MSTPVLRLALALLPLVSVGCSGGGGGSSASTAPSGPALAVSYAAKQLDFSWSDYPGATHYRLYVNPDGASGFTQVGADIPAGTLHYLLPVAVHLQQWARARYLLEACDPSGCRAGAQRLANGDILATIDQLTPSNADALDEFGSAVAISGDGNYLAVGAPRERSAASGVNGDQGDNSLSDAGAVYLFHKVAGAWQQQAYIKASNPDDDDRFGSALALDGDGATLAVGADLEDSASSGIDGDPFDNSARDPGAVYLFTRNGSVWSQQAYIKASNVEPPAPDYTEIADHFGNAVALSDSGDTLAVGAPYEDGLGAGGNDAHHCAYPTSNCSVNAGAVYLFTRNAGVWQQSAYLKGANTEGMDNFGTALDLDAAGNTLIVGAPYEDGGASGVNGMVNDALNLAGAAYLFEYNGSHWYQTAYLKAGNPDGIDFFGSAVAISGDGLSVAVGAPREASAATGIDGNGNDDSIALAGAAYLYRKVGGTWGLSHYLKPSNTDDNQYFGGTLALNQDGSVLAVGATGDDSHAVGIGGNQDDNSTSFAGAVYLFVERNGTWSQRAYVKSPTTALQDSFGLGLDLSRDAELLAVGAKTDTVAGFPADQGALFLY